MTHTGNGVLAIQHLQKDYRAYYSFLNFMSSVGDPRNIFAIYFPLWFQLNQTVGTKMIWVAVIGDWFNLIFKWILFGHRPYWWVQETQIYPNHSSPCLEQFPTTCETGPGVLVAEVFEYTPGIQTASLSTYLKTNLFLFLFALGFYLLLRLLDIDLLWSVPIAKKWCANPDWIHIDTTPFAGLVRNLGVLFGLGFAINSEMFLRSCRGENGYRLSFRLLCTLASLTTLQLYHFIKIPTDTEYLFYVLSFCKSASIPLTVVALIPYCIHMLMKPSAKKLN
ncbi:hypothetical protein MJG53_002975 [Ovis ammon polii x Ovis aries]|uniref:Glucose-6-phosphatase n=2 Tax=Ovis TaxID=9935 RepID=A0AAD4UG76_OVIAM|nr:hypothetical protein MG293_004390 [Ovis ammon polii]KAI4575043.1 hypothetical protein MJT46_004322 [Ovis ammon polii x Ovis aries]KAI4588567.1 hypothetical protein MJG53_002975 [Ovis ammon polii x Ovis aries]